MQAAVQARKDAIPRDLSPIVEALCSVAADLSSRIAMGPLGGILGASVGSNTDGDDQKALDVIADKAFFTAVRGTGVRWFASEEREAIEEVDPHGRYAIAIDPLDGSSNIDVNVSIGTIFGISGALDDNEATFLREGSNLIASGYFIYGPRTLLVATFGQGALQFVLDARTRIFRQVDGVAVIPSAANEYAINASNYRHWPKPIRTYIDDCIAGADGPRAKNFNMRWVASLVAETHRIITRGGIFLYPADERRGYEHGRLRLVYECAPIAFVVEQAGGKATTGTERILDRVPDGFHARTPFVFGASEKVDRLIAYHDLPDQEVSALFGTRGLFRA